MAKCTPKFRKGIRPGQFNTSGQACVGCSFAMWYLVIGASESELLGCSNLTHFDMILLLLSCSVVRNPFSSSGPGVLMEMFGCGMRFRLARGHDLEVGFANAKNAPDVLNFEIFHYRTAACCNSSARTGAARIRYKLPPWS